MSTSSTSEDMGPPGMADSWSLSASVQACAVVALLVSGAALAGRFYARGRLKKALGAEDWCLLAAWILSLGNTIVTCFSAQDAIGHHIYTVSPDAMTRYLKDSWVSVLFYQNSMALSKISILLLYIRVLRYQATVWAAYIMLAIVVTYNVLGDISTFTLCIPLEAYWNPNIHGSCHPESFLWAVVGLHIGTDFLIFLIPLPVIWALRLPGKQKFGVFCIFLLGFFVCLISIIRTVIIKQLLDSQDFTWDYTAVTNWTSVELNTAILVPCLIVMKPLIVKLWPSVFIFSGQEPGGSGRERGADHEAGVSSLTGSREISKRSSHETCELRAVRGTTHYPEFEEQPGQRYVASDLQRLPPVHIPEEIRTKLEAFGQ